MIPTEARPWHREPWPWILMAGPAVVIVAGSILSAVAWLGADALVADDYYKQGLAINRTLARENCARALGIRASLAFDTGNVHATLNATAPLPDRIRLRLIHATRAADDRTTVLSAGAAGGYSAPLGAFPEGRWGIVLETADWRIATTAEVRPGRVVRIDAGGS